MNSHEPEIVTSLVRLASMERFLADAPPGNVVEVGVFQGGSIGWLARRFPLRLFYGFDTFTGMPVAGPLDNHHKAGDFGDTSYEQAVSALGDLPNVTLVKGTFPRSAAGIELAPVSLAHIDVDLYTSTFDAMQFVVETMPRGARIYCDDAFVRTCEGATHAFIEFCAGRRLLPRFDNDFHAFVEIP